MKLKLRKGMTYLVKTRIAEKNTFWLVQQTGQRSWIATQFTTNITNYDDANIMIYGNGLKVADELSKLSDTYTMDWRGVVSTKDMREQMFEILKHGEFQE